MAINNSGTASCYPRFVAVGPGKLYHLINRTTGDEIHFDITLQAGEKVTLRLDMQPKTFVSTFRGDIIDKIIEGSDVTTFKLAPGENEVSVFVDDATAVAWLEWDDMHWSVDGGAA